MRRGFLAFLICMFLGFSANAQYDAKAKAVLDKVSANYQSYTTIQADLSLSIEEEQEKPFLVEGKLALERMSRKYKLLLGDQEIISNGVTQWTILRSQHEVQINDVDKEDHSLNPATIFTFYKTGYKGTYQGSSKVGTHLLASLVLLPIDSQDNVSKIELRVDQNTDLIYDATIFDKNGTKYTYRIKKLTVNEKIHYTEFIFNKNNYPPMEVVDLR